MEQGLRLRGCERGGVLDRHIWILTPLIVIVLWLVFTYMKIKLFVAAGGGTLL
ncbi:MAG TPA: hypothetical protein VF104_05725 [Burkholderiales bacterium]